MRTIPWLLALLVAAGPALSLAQEGHSLRRERGLAPGESLDANRTGDPEVTPQRRAALKSGRQAIENVWDAAAYFDALKTPPGSAASRSAFYLVKSTPSRLVRQGDLFICVSDGPGADVAFAAPARQWGDWSRLGLVVVVGRLADFMDYVAPDGRRLRLPVLVDAHVEVSPARL